MGVLACWRAYSMLSKRAYSIYSMLSRRAYSIYSMLSRRAYSMLSKCAYSMRRALARWTARGRARKGGRLPLLGLGLCGVGVGACVLPVKI